jgi:methionine synthase II (cobalamin-independent)
MQLISRKTTIEDLVEIKPGAINYLSKKGIRCILCGEPIWGSLEEAARLKGFTDAEIDLFVEELNQIKN